MGQAQFAGHRESVGTTSPKYAPDAVGNFTESVIEDGIDDSFLHHLLHGITSGSDGVEGDDLVSCFFEELDGMHRSLGENAEIGHANDPFGFALGDALLGLSHAPGGCRGVSEDLPGEDVQSQDIGHCKHHGDVLDADKGRSVT